MFGTRDSRSWPSASKSLRQNLAKAEQAHASTYRLIVVGGHTRSIGKTQLVCDLVAALPEANFIAGKITQYGTASARRTVSTAAARQTNTPARLVGKRTRQAEQTARGFWLPGRSGRSGCARNRDSSL